MLTKIDYADNGIQHFKSKLPAHMQFVAFNTNVPHVLAESDYGKGNNKPQKKPIYKYKHPPPPTPIILAPAMYANVLSNVV